jgi:hypothetical protein
MNTDKERGKDVNLDPQKTSIEVPQCLICSCNEPLKITLDSGVSPMSCPVCGSFIAHDDPEEASRDFDLLRRFWLKQGRRDYAGQ